MNPKMALKIYKRRWSIETLFAYLKTKGFGFEDTHMSDKKKIEAWMFILTLALVWTLKTRLAIKHVAKYAKHGRKRKSLFRCCFELIKRYLSNFEQYLKELLTYVRLLSFSKKPSWRHFKTC